MNIYFLGMCVSFAIYLIISFFVSKKVKTTNDFFVAGRNAPLILIVGSMVASYVSTGMFMGDAGEYYSGLFSPMTILATMQVVGYIYGAVFFGRYLRRSEVLTIPDFFGKRFCSEKVRVLSIVISIITMTVYLLSVMQGIGTLMNVVTGIDYNLCIVIALVVFVLVSILSGASGVLITDTLMFAVFTLSLIIAAFVIVKKGGGLTEVVNTLMNNSEKKGLLTWDGNTDYLYNSGLKNCFWGIIYGVVWLSVCMVGPWQSSRYLMAKNEHVVVRSSLFSALGIFLLQLLAGIASVAVNVFNPNLENASHVLLWASKNVLPTALGVVLLTGVLAAGISSATTFLSLIGSSVSNDIFKGKGKSIAISRVSMIAVSVVVLLLAITNPPQIRIILYFGGSIVAASWLPVAVASIISKRVTREATFWGMLIGFVGCFVMKLLPSLLKISLPLICDPTVVGILLNVITLIVVSLFTSVSEEEKSARDKLFVIPESEKKPEDVAKTKKYLIATILLGVFVTVVLLLVWAIPVVRA